MNVISGITVHDYLFLWSIIFYKLELAINITASFPGSQLFG